MDTTKEYIEMCEKATDIQKMIKPTAGDWILCKWKKYSDSVKVLSSKTMAIKYGNVLTVGVLPKIKISSMLENSLKLNIDMVDFDLIPISEWIWLPRQDQLQEMVIDNNPNLLDRCFKLATHFMLFAFGHKQFLTMEKLWIAFVMQEKFDKQWNGKEWVKYENHANRQQF